MPWQMGFQENSKVKVIRYFLTWSLIFRQSYDSFLSTFTVVIKQDAMVSTSEEVEVHNIPAFDAPPQAFISKSFYLLLGISFKGSPWVTGFCFAHTGRELEMLS